MLEDKVLKDTMRMYIDTKSITRDCFLKKKDEDIYAIKEEDETKKLQFKQSDTDHLRVKAIIDEYNKNTRTNPICMLDSFRNKHNIPFSFTYTEKNKMHKAVVYVGGEICKIVKLIIVGFGVDANIRVARYKAAEEAIKKVKEKYGDDSLQFKGMIRRQNKANVLEQIEKQRGEAINSSITISNTSNSDDLLKETLRLFRKDDTDSGNQLKLEAFITVFERSIIPISEYFEIQKLLCLFLQAEKPLSIHFDNPILAGSFLYDCPYRQNLTVDIIFPHKSTQNALKENVDILLKNLKLATKDHFPEIFITIKNRLNDTNLDLLVRIKAKNFTMRLLIRDEAHRNLINYLKYHNAKVSANLKQPDIFNALRRLFRLFRRQKKITFLLPETIDWIIKDTLDENHPSTLLCEWVIKNAKKLSKNVIKNIQKISNLPSVINVEVEKLNDEQVEKIQNSFKDVLDDMHNLNIKSFIINN